MEKPKKPQEPNHHHYKSPKESNAQNCNGKPLYINFDYIDDYHKYQKQLEQYKVDMEVYEQIKLIKLVKNSTEKYCLKNIKITKLK